MFKTLSTKDVFKTAAPVSQTGFKLSHTNPTQTQSQQSVLLEAHQGSKPSLIDWDRIQGQDPVTPTGLQWSVPLQTRVGTGQRQPTAPSTSHQCRSPLTELHFMQNQKPSLPYNSNTISSIVPQEECNHQVLIDAPWQDGFNRNYETPISGIGHAVKFLSSSISSFGGTEEENVAVWLEKIEVIARNYNLSPTVRLSAATSKLNKMARRWFNLSTGDICESWTSFKTAITRRFKRRIVFQAVMQKIENRKWMYSSETFQEYAMDKLLLIQH